MTTNFIPCRTCAKKDGPGTGYYYVKLEERTYVQECSCHKRWREGRELSRKFEKANIWNTSIEYDPEKDYKGLKSLEDVNALKKYVELFRPRFSDKMIYVYGPNGTQKTTLAMWVGRQLLQRGHSVLYTLMETLSVSLSPDFKAEDDSRERFIQRALDVDLLIIDEAFDRSKFTLYKSGYQIPFLDRFFRERFDIGKRAIMFISNKRSDSLSAQGFGDSLQSLIMRNTCSSTLTFEDVYIQNANTIDPKGIFK
jgi:hypothetical protein